MKLITAMLACAAALLPQVSAAPQIPAPGKGAPVSPAPDDYTFNAIQLKPEQKAHIQKLITTCARAEVARHVGKRREARIIVEGEELAAILNQLNRVERWYSRSYKKKRPIVIPPHLVIVKLYDERDNVIGSFARSTNSKFDFEKFYADATGRPVSVIDLFEAFLP